MRKSSVQRMMTVHMPDPPKPRKGCMRTVSDGCSENHYFQVPAISQRGTWPLMEMLSHSSIQATLTIYNALRNH